MHTRICNACIRKDTATENTFPLLLLYDKYSLVLINKQKSVTRALFIRLLLKIFIEFPRKQSPKKIDKYNKLRNQAESNLFTREKIYCIEICV